MVSHKESFEEGFVMALDNSSAYLKIFVISYFASLLFLLYHKNSNVVYCNLYNKMLVTLKGMVVSVKLELRMDTERC